MPLSIEIEVQGCEQEGISVTTQCENLTLEVTGVQGCEQADISVTNQCENLTLEVTERAVYVAISAEPDNRLEMKADGLYIRDRLEPDPVAYYL